VIFQNVQTVKENLMVSILAIGDPHFKSDNALQTNALTKEIAKIIRATPSIDGVVVLGDVLHRHDRVDLHPLHRAIAFFSHIRASLDFLDSADGPLKRRAPRPLWILIGNHDRPNNTTYLTDEHPFTALKAWENTIIADTVIVEDIPSSDGRQHLFALVPYVPTGRFNEAMGGHSRWWETIVDFKEGERIAAVFAHQEFRGCALASSITSKSGDPYPRDAPICISGHIHTRSSPQKNVVYPGVPVFHGFVDATSSERPSVSIFTFDGTGAPERTKECQIFLETIPKNILIPFASADVLSSVIEDAKRKRIPVTDHILAIAGIPKSDGAKIRISVKCASNEEFKARVASTSAFSTLSTEGTSLSAVVSHDMQSREKSSEPAIPFAKRLADSLVSKSVSPDVKEYIEQLFNLGQR
jgi:DNA repair exonuclease SbcCD nuclease subunit